MKKSLRVLSISLIVVLLTACMSVLLACNGKNVDYVSQVTFTPSAGRAYQEVTVKLFVDGDTTHFYVNTPINGSKTLKARYLAVNTPESTGKIEEYGKKASNFTKEKLSTATSIIVESDSAIWEADSTGERILSWVWYQPEANAPYRLLNLELLQNGLAIASSTANNTYGDICTKALNQAKEQKLNVYSGKKDPDMFYGEAIELTLKELRTSIEYYSGSKVAFEGVITRFSNNGVYVEEYDEETELYYGIYVYYSYNFAGESLLAIGNRMRIVGSLQYWEGGGTYQIADLQYRPFKPDDPNNIQKIGEGYEASYKETSPEDFLSGKRKLIVTEEGEEVAKEFSYAELAMDTSITMKDLKVVETYTTTNPDTSSVGAFTLTCETTTGKTIEVRTAVLYDENGNLVTADAYMGKTLTVKGFVGYYDGNYQIQILSVNDLIIQE